MRCVEKFAAALVAPAILSAGAANAYTSAGWKDVQPIIAALPSGFGDSAVGHIPQSVLAEIQKEVQPVKGAPASWTVIYGGTPNREKYTRRSDGLVECVFSDEVSGSCGLSDPLGLIEVTAWATSPTFVDVTLSLSGPISENSADVDETATAFDIDLSGTRVGIIDQACHLRLEVDSVGTVERQCTNTIRYLYNDYDGNASDRADEIPQRMVSSGTIEFQFNKNFGFFLRDSDVIDWKIGGQPWHSQIASAALSKQEKNAARALFARGFDLYKSGDLTGARALIENGLWADPANYLAWFTLGEIGRSMATVNPDNTLGKRAEAVYYQHTIDLAPDSPEAALAKGYLDALH